MKENSIQVADTIIRRATEEDAAEIANVHLNSWRETYRGLLPQDYLDSLPLTFKQRMDFWQKAAVSEDKALFVAEAKVGIVGFNGLCHTSDPTMKNYGEVGAVLNGMEQDDEIGGLKIKDHAYEWKSLHSFKD